MSSRGVTAARSLGTAARFLQGQGPGREQTGKGALTSSSPLSAATPPFGSRTHPRGSHPNHALEMEELPLPFLLWWRKQGQSLQ